MRSEEEKEQWLYEEYKYTSNFNFNRLDKYEEANNDLCIDDLILDYTMLYEHYKKEIERLKNIIKEVRELVENGTDFKSIYFKKDNEDLWKVILSNEIKEKYLEILDKGKE